MLIIFTDKPIDSDTLIKRAVKEYCGLFNKPCFTFEIMRPPGGKPYMEPKKLCFNLSHSGIYSICAVSEREVGIDVQYHDEKTDLNSIAAKYGLPQSKTEFFSAFAMAEASAKLAGDSVFRALPYPPSARIIPFAPQYSLAVSGDDSEVFLTEIYI